MSDRKLGKVAKTLIEARKLIENERNWCQHSYSRYDGEFHELQFCALGAIRKLTFDNMVKISGSCIQSCIQNYGESPEMIFLKDVCMELHHTSVAGFNDSRSHAQVLGLFDAAIGRAINNPYVGYEQRDFFDDDN